MTHRSAAERRLVTLGHIAGVHGVNGWVKVHSLTEPREAIFEYQPWRLGEEHEEVRVLQGKKHGNRLIALLEGMEDRDQAETLVNRAITVFRDEMPELGPGQYYWEDLLGATVQLEDGRELGRVENLLATGANDVLVVRGERERLIPFVMGQYVKQVDLDGGRITVDWDPEF